jgi:hypothetical protein
VKRNPIARAFTNPHFQLWLNIGALVAAVVLTAVAPVLGLLSSVPYVSWLSQIALIYGGLSGVSAALVYLDAKTGYMLNAADWERIAEMIKRETP